MPNPYTLEDLGGLNGGSILRGFLSTSHADDGTIAPAGPMPYFDVRAYGARLDSVTDDTAAIQAAINACNTFGGGIVYIPANNGNWVVVNGTLNLTDMENIRIVGPVAPNHIYTGQPNLGVCLRRLSGTGIMLNWSASSAAQSLRGTGIENIVFDGAGLATTVVQLKSHYGGQFRNLHIREGSSVGLAISTVDLSGTEDFQKCIFENIAVRCTAASAKGITMGSWGSGGGNTSLNLFQNFITYTNNGTGIELGDTDSNVFMGVEVNRSGSAVGMDLLGTSSGAASGHCRDNFIFGIDGPAGITARATGYTRPSQNNVVFMGRANGTAYTVEPGASLFVHDSRGRTNVRPSYQQESFIKDDFSCGNNGSGVGELGWQVSGAAFLATPVAGHPGVIRIDTGAGAGTVNYVSLATVGQRTFLASDLFDCTFVVRLNTNDTDTQVRVGVTAGAAGDPATDGAYVEKLYADVSWFGCNRAGGSQTRTAALAGTSTNWATMRIRRVDATNIGYSFNGAAEVLLSTNAPSANVVPFVQIKNQTAVSKTIDFDYFECWNTGLSRT